MRAHLVHAAALLLGLLISWRTCRRFQQHKGTPLASATGDLGLMQVNRNTWRGFYDLKGLGGDIQYNANAGGEILLYYLTKYAIR